jgi:hypothetical protein
VIDHRDPDRLVTVCIKINGRRAGRVCAVHNRDDVAGLLNTKGRHGIAFRLPPQYRSAKRLKIEIIADNGLPINNLSYRFFQDGIDGKSLPQDRTGPQVLFLHIPKTAGTAFRTMVRKSLFGSERLLIYPEPPGIPPEMVCMLPESQLKQFRIIYGHFFFGLHEQLPDTCRYITVLRDPVRRLISHYFHHLRRGGISPDSVSFDLQGAPPSEEFDNLMVRLISGEHLEVGKVTSRTLHHAVRNLDRFFDFVGIQEDPETWTELQSHLGLKGEMRQENVGVYDASLFETPARMAHLKRMTAYDQELYRYAQKLAKDRRAAAHQVSPIPIRRSA